MKKTIKTVLVIFMMLSFVLGLASCAKQESDKADNSVAVGDFTFSINEGLSDDAKIVANKIDASEEKGKAIRNIVKSHLIADDSPIVIYDIYAEVEGLDINPTGELNATLKSPIQGVKNYAVYHIKNDGTIETIEVSAKDGKLSFDMTVGSNSYFVFAEKTTYQFKITEDVFMDTLPIIGQCLIGVFGSIAFIILVIYILNKAANRLESRRNDEE